MKKKFEKNTSSLSLIAPVWQRCKLLLFWRSVPGRYVHEAAAVLQVYVQPIPIKFVFYFALLTPIGANMKQELC